MSLRKKNLGSVVLLSPLRNSQWWPIGCCVKRQSLRLQKLIYPIAGKDTIFLYCIEASPWNELLHNYCIFREGSREEKPGF